MVLGNGECVGGQSENKRYETISLSNSRGKQRKEEPRISMVESLVTQPLFLPPGAGAADETSPIPFIFIK